MSLLHAGLDIGSTTAKAVVLDDEDRILFSRYIRHFADIQGTARRLLAEIRENYFGSAFTMSVAGSGALELAEGMSVPFTQEQIACSRSINRYLPNVDVCIELGGEDAKLTFFDPSGAEQRMNESCAGGTGAFIDQMAALLGVDALGLNELAKGHKMIYPIASRCGVFAKTDVQPLLNDGASRNDIAASIFQAIVNQTISGLACGRRICGNVAFLGGPLYFLSELRKRFTETLRLREDQCIFPENPHLFVAMGAAISGKSVGASGMDVFENRVSRFYVSQKREKNAILPALFEDDAARAAFKSRHGASAVRRGAIESYSGAAYLGIDVGSTTTKAVLLGSASELLFSAYKTSGGGDPLGAVRDIMTDLYSKLPSGAHIAKSGVTGYGEKMIKSAFGLDIGEVETVAHARAADFFLPGADFVIDIGGQDMKCLGIKGGVINKVFLNEACSSGCGSFLQSFAESLRMGVAEFALSAEKSSMPVDLGSRCTVFMNSRVRQAQKDGAEICDISAGLVYSVVRNALYKVLKIKNTDELGNHIVVQGGTFKNDALLRAFELLTGREVVRPDIPELMGAFGAALIAKDSSDDIPSSVVSAEGLKNFSASASTSRCSGCGNACILTKTKFGDGRSYVSGNRCEKGGMSKGGKALPPNIFEMKYKRLFGYEPISAAEAKHGTVGMPRVLNMYEDYPFWFTLFTALGFRVVLSSKDPDKNLGIDTIPSQTVCYPAKLVHRHIIDLMDKGVDSIFYPIMQKDKGEFKDAQKSFNCPVVTGYPDVVWLNIDALRESGIKFMRPSLCIDSENQIADMLSQELAHFKIGKREIRKAFKAASAEQERFKSDIAEMGRAAAKRMREEGGKGIILAGHPYHLNPEVNHGIPELINSYGVTVFTEDSVCRMSEELACRDNISVVDQWVYHSRLYRAAMVTASHPDFKSTELIQLNSFGCGLDAISSEQTSELLEKHGRLYTILKIDEGKNNGAVNIRIRSLLAAMKSNRTVTEETVLKRQTEVRKKICGTPERTILCPPLSAHHFQFLDAAFESVGIRIKVLPEGTREAVELGLKYVNNDLCYPAVVVVGQFLQALKSGEYDPDRTDCLYAQTGGACRASNYVHLLRKSLDAAGFPNVRILAANAQEGSEAEKFKIPLPAAWRSMLALIYGDLLMRLSLRVRPYEINRGDTEALYSLWSAKIRENVRAGSWKRYKADVRKMVSDFSRIPTDSAPRPRVGVVGEILVKYHANANEHIVETIEREGGEAVVSDLSGFLLYCLADGVYSHSKLGGGLMSAVIGGAGIKIFERLRAPVKDALRGTKFGDVDEIDEMSRMSEGLVSQSNQAGEGWLLSAEMVRLIESGVRNILCIQPFSCLPNHITGKGVIKELKSKYKNVNILPLDYDASVSNVNQLNRIKLLMATSKI